MSQNYSRYDDDEILIFSGKLADNIIENSGRLIHPEHVDECRNAAADAAETVMKQWTGSASVPLPQELLSRMTDSAATAITTTHSRIILG